METVDKLVQRCRSKELKITPQRLGIFKILEGNSMHPTAGSIYNEIKKSFPTISFTTVYKTLKILEEIGEISEITVDAERKHYDPNTDVHHHIICLKCNRISDIKENYIKPRLPKKILNEFTPSSYQVSFYGTCRKCQLK